MKQIFCLLFIILIFLPVRAQDFITTWQVNNDNTSIEFEATTTGPVTYTWTTLPPATPATGSGTFQGPLVTISGFPSNNNDQMIELSIQPQNFKSFKFIDPGFFFTYNLQEVNQWGSVEWDTFEDAFNGAQLAVVATDIPNLTFCSNLKNMFSNNFTFNSASNINFWDISKITNMSGMFSGCDNYNQALSQWDTSNVTDMSNMFLEAKSFNQNIGTWNTSSVTDMSQMFKNAYQFNSNIGNWDTSNVTNMSEMFFADFNSGFTSKFNKNIGNWNTSNVTDMSAMFSGAVLFNKDIGNWNTSNVTDMSQMFKMALVFNQNLGNWDTSNVTDMSEMFMREQLFFENDLPETYAFNNAGNPTIANWNTFNVADFSGMFSRADMFDQQIGDWSIAQAQDLTSMLDRSGMDCDTYSATLVAWNNDNNTPDGLTLGAELLEYRSYALPAINNLLFNKGWSISGHDIVSSIPEFNIDNTYCQGEPVITLPNTSIDGINGSWTPDFDPTQTTTYTFTPNADECALETSITINVVDGISEPSGSSTQTLTSGATLDDINITPATILWYASQQDALNNDNILPPDTLIEDGVTYYAVNDNGQCRSQPFAVTVFITLNIQQNEFKNLRYYPNPVDRFFYIENDKALKSITIYDISGRKLFHKTYNNNKIKVSLEKWNKSVYLMLVKTEEKSKNFKIIKR